MDSNTKIIYVRLLDEGTEVFRPVKAVHIKNNIYSILKTSKFLHEKWEFKPGSTVLCEEIAENGELLVIAKKLNK